MLLSYRAPVAFLLKDIALDLLIIATMVGIVGFLDAYFENVLPVLPFNIAAFMGTALSIILSFKVGQSYDRWWEARKIWGAIVNDSRSWLLQLQGFLPASQEAFVHHMAYRQMAWCWSLGQSLRKLDPIKGLEAYLSPEECRRLGNHANVPLAILQLQMEDLRQLRAQQDLHVFEHIQLDDTLVRLCASMGKAERIKSTVFPTTYRILLHVVLYCFAVCLILALSAVPIYWGFPLIMAIVAAFLLLERSAYYLQDPFENRPTDTAMSAIARTIEINLKQLLEEREVPAPLEAEQFYLM